MNRLGSPSSTASKVSLTRQHAYTSQGMNKHPDPCKNKKNSSQVEGVSHEGEI